MGRSPGPGLARRRGSARSRRGDAGGYARRGGRSAGGGGCRGRRRRGTRRDREPGPVGCTGLSGRRTGLAPGDACAARYGAQPGVRPGQPPELVRIARAVGFKLLDRPGEVGSERGLPIPIHDPAPRWSAMPRRWTLSIPEEASPCPVPTCRGRVSAGDGPFCRKAIRYRSAAIPGSGGLAGGLGGPLRRSARG